MQTKHEYDKCNDLLTQFLYEADTVKVIGTACRNAVIVLQGQLAADEAKYAGYFRQTVKNCHGAMTTSPVEGHNRVLKHGPLKINANYHLHTVMHRIIQTIRRQLTQGQNRAVRQLSKTNCASNAPTKKYVINEGQALMDRNYDQRMHVKSVRTSPTSWVAWLPFSCDHPEDCAENPEYLKIPQFLRVHQLDIRSVDNKPFIHCSCEQRRTSGIPCPGVFCLLDRPSIPVTKQMTVGMVDVSWLKIFHSHYGEKNDIGNSIMAAQSDCFANEDHGTCVDIDAFRELRSSDNNVYPKLGRATSDEDWQEAQYVMNHPACTLIELEYERMKSPEERWKKANNFSPNMKAPSTAGVSLTVAAAQMQRQLVESLKGDTETTGKGMLPSEDKKASLYKKWQEDLKTLFCNDLVDTDLMKDIDKCLDELVATVNDLTMEDGSREGGECCLELFGYTTSYQALVAQKRGAM